MAKFYVLVTVGNFFKNKKKGCISMKKKFLALVLAGSMCFSSSVAMAGGNIKL